jgi:hypothetical protein
MWPDWFGDHFTLESKNELPISDEIEPGTEAEAEAEGEGEAEAEATAGKETETE